MHKTRVIVSRSFTPQEDIADFPLYLDISSPAFKLASSGGCVRSPDGADIFFTSLDTLPLPFQLLSYDAAAGSIKAWVKLPLISSRQDTVFYVCCGNPAMKKTAAQPCFDPLHEIMLCGSALNSPLAAANLMSFDDALTVEAWIKSDDQHNERFQPLVSKWSPSVDFKAFAAFDAGNVDALRSQAYFGAVFDGRYIYFSPEQYELEIYHGTVLRYDTHQDFKDPAAYQAYDASATDGLNTRGFYGALFDGRYVYFVPRQNEKGYHSIMLRYDTSAPFKQSSSWQAFDVCQAHSQQGVAFDGRFIYFCPGYQGDTKTESAASASVIRYDTLADFKSMSSYSTFDASSVSGLATGCFDGGAFDGRFIYFVPLGNGIPVRYDTKRDFLDPASWQAFNAGDLGMGLCVGAVFDGTFMYYAAYGQGRIIRFDTRSDFSDSAAWSAFSTETIPGIKWTGYDGGFFDGRFVYFVPFGMSVPADTPDCHVNRGKGFKIHCDFVRYDTTKQFTDPAAWQFTDAANVDGLKTIGYNAGAFDGRYFYCAPWQQGRGYELGPGKIRIHGTILRYDTVGSNASFSLRYCDYGHNGGLCAAVRGPAFLVNTDSGVAGVSVNRKLKPEYRHLVGVYDRATIRLYIDGLLAASLPYCGKIIANDIPITFGRLNGAPSAFKGTIYHVRIANLARSETWIHAAWRNCIAARQYINLEP